MHSCHGEKNGLGFQSWRTCQELHQMQFRSMGVARRCHGALVQGLYAELPSKMGAMELKLITCSGNMYCRKKFVD